MRFKAYGHKSKSFWYSMINSWFYRLATVLALCCSATLAMAQDERFNVSAIEVEGLGRIDKGAVLNALPVREGQPFVVVRDSARAIKGVYKTGLFDDVKLFRDGNALIVVVKERPAIAEINLNGNEKLKDEDLLDALRRQNIAPGRVFNRSVLETMQKELRQLYLASGNYGMSVETEIRPLERNRVGIDIDVTEGDVARIRRINIVGNSVYSDDKLLGLMNSGVTSNPFSSKDEYSKVKLSADLETIKSYYHNRGYIRFDVSSTQVSLSPDKRDIYITINVQEGAQYRLHKVSFSGRKIIDDAELRGLMKIAPGELFSRRAIIDSNTAISDRLGEDGYAFADINVSPSINDDTHTVDVNFAIAPGERVYVRRIIFSGNDRTRDEVLRREMRQFEGAPFSPAAIKRSRERIQRLPYIENVSIDTEQVSGAKDQADIKVTVVEGNTGSFSITGGISSDDLVLGINFDRDNLFGSGERVTLQADNSSATKRFSLTYRDPYYTRDGISRTISASFRETNTSKASSTAAWIADVSGLSLSYGFPLSEYARWNLGAGWERDSLSTTNETPKEIEDLIDAQGDKFSFFKLTTGFSHDTRNRTVFPESGTLNSIGLEASVPGMDLEYYKLSYSFSNYFSLTPRYVLSSRFGIKYGAGYGDEANLPFFKRYYSGGIQTVRGFRSSSLGPRALERNEDGTPKLDANGDVIRSNNALGGDFRLQGTFALVMPPPFADPETRSTRLSVFTDVGSVYEDYDTFDSEELRITAGLGLIWITPIGPLTFSYAEPLNEKSYDRLQPFQWSIGTVF